VSCYYPVSVPRCPALSAEVESDLFVAYRQRRTAARRERIVRQYLYWASEIAFRYCGPRMAREDAVGAANLGLMQAIEDFDPARGRRFVTHSYFHIRRAVLTALRDTYVVNPAPGINVQRHLFNKDRLDRKSFAEAKRKVFDNAGTPCPLNHDSATDGADVQDKAEDSSMLELLRGRVSALEEPAKSIFTLRYFSDDTPLFKEIGDRLGLTEDSARYIHNRTMLKLRESLAKEL